MCFLNLLFDKFLESSYQQQKHQVVGLRHNRDTHVIQNEHCLHRTEASKILLYAYLIAPICFANLAACTHKLLFLPTLKFEPPAHRWWPGVQVPSRHMPSQIWPIGGPKKQSLALHCASTRFEGPNKREQFAYYGPRFFFLGQIFFCYIRTRQCGREIPPVQRL